MSRLTLKPSEKSTDKRGESTDSPFLSLQQEIRRALTPPPFEEGWRNIAEVAAELGLGKNRTQVLLASWLRGGYVERWEGRCDSDRGVRVRTTRYRRIAGVKPAQIARRAS